MKHPSDKWLHVYWRIFVKKSLSLQQNLSLQQVAQILSDLIFCDMLPWHVAATSHLVCTDLNTYKKYSSLKKPFCDKLLHCFFFILYLNARNCSCTHVWNETGFHQPKINVYPYIFFIGITGTVGQELKNMYSFQHVVNIPAVICFAQKQHSWHFRLVILSFLWICMCFFYSVCTVTSLDLHLRTLFCRKNENRHLLNSFWGWQTQKER